MKIGTFVQQPQGFKAFIPEEFPPKKEILLDLQTQQLHANATLALGKLDGITQLLPDLDFFIFMYVRKEAAYSSQIEGTKATMIDAIRAETELTKDLPSDVNDILRYIDAMNYGLKNLERLPLSTRLLCEIHKVLMDGARTDTYVAPGELRSSQNWINGSNPITAKYVPPPVYEMQRALSDFEKFIHNESNMLHLIKVAMAHAQFETIHPFLDGNGRTGRLFITFYLCQQKILERPVLYLSVYLKKHRRTYFDLLDAYHEGEITPWINFFLIGVEEVANQAIKTAKAITELRERDLAKLYTLGKRGKMAELVLKNLYKLPIINVGKIEEWTGLSRPSANKLVRDLIALGILYQNDEEVQYARQFNYRDYVKLFRDE
jgi:Fic family protein